MKIDKDLQKAIKEKARANQFPRGDISEEPAKEKSTGKRDSSTSSTKIVRKSRRNSGTKKTKRNV